MPIHIKKVMVHPYIYDFVTVTLPSTVYLEKSRDIWDSVELIL